MSSRAMQSARRWQFRIADNHQQSVAALIASLLGLVVAAGPVASWLAAPMLLIFLTVGPGLALHIWAPMRRSVAAVIVPSCGLTLVTIYATIATQWRGWSPVGSLLILSGVTFASATARLVYRRSGRPAAAHRQYPTRAVQVRWEATPSLLLSLTGLIVAGWGIVTLRHAPGAPFGLLFANGPWLALAVGCVVVSFVLAVRAHRIRDVVVALLAVIAIIRLPIALLTSLPIFGWTYKHLGVVDYITVHGAVAPGVDIYSGWPGFFAMMSWLSQLSGVSALTIAQWFPVVYHLLLAAAFIGLARAWGASMLTSLVVAFVGEIVNWVGQDYFSPQAFAYLLAVLCLTLLLGESRQGAWYSIPLFMAMTMSHQLTPYWIIAVALILGIFGKLRPRYIGVIFAVIAMGYLLLNWDSLGSNPLFTTVDPIANANRDAGGAGSAAYRLTTATMGLCAGVLWVASGCIAVTKFIQDRSGRPAWFAAAVVAFSPFYFLALQNYGGEAILRVYLFSLPGCALLIAPLAVRALSGTMRWAAPTISLVLVVSAAALQAFYGPWFTNVVRPDAYRAVTAAYQHYDPPAKFLSLVQAGPGRQEAKYVAFAQYDALFDSALTSYPGWIGQTFETTDTLDALTKRLRQDAVPTLVMISQQMIAMNDYAGFFPAGAIARLTDQWRHSADWTAIIDTPTLHIFSLIQ